MNREGKILDSPGTARRHRMTNTCLFAKEVTFILILEIGLSIAFCAKVLCSMKEG